MSLELEHISLTFYIFVFFFHLVITHCQIENRPAVMYVVYMENIYFDMADIATFRQVLEAPPLKGLVKVGIISAIIIYILCVYSYYM